MNVYTRTLEPGEATLPAELRIRRGPHVYGEGGHHYGWGEGPPNPFPGAGHHYAYGRERLLQGMRGLGQCDPTTDPTCTEPVPVYIPPYNPPTLPDAVIYQADIPGLTDSTSATMISEAAGLPPAGWTGPTVLTPTATVPTPPSGYQWATLINQSGQQLARILAISQGGSSIQLPNGMVMNYGSPGVAQTAAAAQGGFFGQGSSAGVAFGGNTMILIGGALLLVLMMSRR